MKLQDLEPGHIAGVTVLENKERDHYQALADDWQRNLTAWQDYLDTARPGSQGHVEATEAVATCQANLKSCRQKAAAAFPNKLLVTLHPITHV